MTTTLCVVVCTGTQFRLQGAASVFTRRSLRFDPEEAIEVVVSDLHLPPHVDDIGEGLALIDVARSQDPPLQVVVITGSDSKRAALEAVRRGAYGFFEKPLDPGELLHIVNQAARMRLLEIENRRLRSELACPPGFVHCSERALRSKKF
jgi:DNA-binding NtrC family response regulator